MSQVRSKFCGCPSRLAATGRPCRWDKTNWDGAKWVGPPKPLQLTYALDSLPEAFATALAWAWREWEKVCAIQVVRIAEPGEALVRFTTGRIDGASGTLAWAELPCGSDRQLECRTDSSDKWHLQPGTTVPRGLTDYGRVACHEIGHLLGLEHENDPNQDSLLDPYYSTTIATPQQWDIAQAVLRYGPPLSIPTDPPPPTPSDNARLVLDGVQYSGVLRRVA